MRARDYNAKKARLKILRQKAAERNPDEFHYGMLSSKSQGGKKIADRGNPVLSHDAVKLLKTQDSGYLQTMIQKTRKARERLEAEFVLTQNRKEGGMAVDVLGKDGGKVEKIIFVANEGEQNHCLDRQKGEKSVPQDNEDGGLEFNANPTLLSASTTRRAIEKEEKLRKERALWRKQHRKEQNARRTKLAALKVREKDLRDAENELELQRAKMSNAIGGVNKNGVKWKQRERKK